MAQWSFNTETGWYHEARQAFVPAQDTGMKAFVFLRPTILSRRSKWIFCKAQSANGEAHIFWYVEPLSVADEPGEKRVPARWGRVGETRAVFIGLEEQKG